MATKDENKQMNQNTNGITQTAMKLFSLNTMFKKGFESKMVESNEWAVILINENGDEDLVFVDNKTMLFRIRSREYISFNEKFYVLDSFNKFEKTARYYESVEK